MRANVAVLLNMVTNTDLRSDQGFVDLARRKCSVQVL